MNQVKSHKKRLLVIGLSTGIVLLSGVGIAAFVITTNKINDIPLAQHELKIEYGEKFSPNTTDLLKTNDDAVKQTIQLDATSLKFKKDTPYPEVGEYNLPVRYTQKDKPQEKTLKLIVVDSTKPEFADTRKNTLELKTTDKKPEFAKLFPVKDLSKTTISVDDSKVKYKKVGKYNATITARDTWGNEAVQNLTIRIVAVTQNKTTPAQPNQPSKQPTNTQKPAPTPQRPAGGLTYVKGILIVNKKHPLPPSYAPGENPTAGAAFRRLVATMRAAGYDISTNYSGFRSYQYQAGLYNSYVRQDGQAQADTYSARPGHSEHQTGLAFDLLNSSGGLMQASRESAWVAKNAHKYGFIVRYQSGKESITGYNTEPWHLRYIGNQASTIYSSGLTLEEYLGVPGGGY